MAEHKNYCPETGDRRCDCDYDDQVRAEENALNKAWLKSLTKWLLDEGHITPLGARMLKKGRG